MSADRVGRLTTYFRWMQIARGVTDLTPLEGPLVSETGIDARPATAFALADFRYGKVDDSKFVRDAFSYADGLLRATGSSLDYVAVEFSPIHVTGNGPTSAKTSFPIFGRAVMNRGGHLSLRGNLLNSDHPPIWLDPAMAAADNGTSLTFGNAGFYVDFACSWQDSKRAWPSEWSDLLAFVDATWRAAAPVVRDGALIDAINQLFPGADAGWIRVAEQPLGTFPLARVYEKLGTDNAKLEHADLYRSLCVGEQGRVWAGEGLLSHLGQMTRQRGLSSPERAVLASHLAADTGRVIAVDGAPSDTRALLAQNAIANAVVQAVLDRFQPPIVIGAGIDEDAVAHLLDLIPSSVETDVEQDDRRNLLRRRWLPTAPNYGIGCAVKREGSSDSMRGRAVFVPEHASVFANVSPDDAIAKIGEGAAGGHATEIMLHLRAASSPAAMATWIRQAEQYLNQTGFVTVEAGQAKLRHKIMRTVAAIRNFSKITARVDQGLTDRGFTSFHEGARKYQMTVKALKDDLAAEQRGIDDARSAERELEASLRAKETLALETINRQVDRASGATVAKLVVEATAVGDRFAHLGPARRGLAEYAEPATLAQWLLDLMPWVRARRMKSALEHIPKLAVALDMELPTLATISIREWLDEADQRIMSYSATVHRVVAEVTQVERAAVTQKDKRVETFEQTRLEREEAARLLDVEREDKLRALSKRLAEQTRILEGFQALHSSWIGMCKALSISEFSSTDDAREQVDKTLRFDAYMMSARYWEGECLVRMREPNLFTDKHKRIQLLRAIACLSPLFAGTFSRLPSVFSGARRWPDADPLWGLADLLLIDAADRCAADEGAATFALAKKAMVFGDAQREYIAEHALDSYEPGIAARSGMGEDAWYERRGARVAGRTRGPGGSLMKIAVSASAFRSFQDSNGMLVRDRFRATRDDSPPVKGATTRRYDSDEVSRVLGKLSFAEPSGLQPPASSV